MDLRKRLKSNILLYRMKPQRVSLLVRLVFTSIGHLPWVGARYGFTKEIGAKGALWLFVNRKMLDDQQRLDLKVCIEESFLSEKKLAKLYADCLKSEKSYKNASDIYGKLLKATPDKQVYESLISCLYLEGQHASVLRCVEDYSSRYYPSFRALSYSYFSSCVTGCKSKEDYLEKIRTFPSGLLKTDYLKLGAQLFFGWADKGFISCAYDYKYAVAYFVSRADFSPEHTLLSYQKIVSDIYQGDFERATKKLKAYSEADDQNFRTEELHEIRPYVDIATSKKQLSPSEINFGGVYIKGSPEATGKTNRFASLLSGKKVAVVGPADTNQDLREEIDGYDVVVRTNVFSRDDFMLDGGRLGQKVDISYYPRAPVGLRKDELIRFAAQESCVFVFRNEKSIEEYGKENLRPQDRVISNSPSNFMPVFQNMHAIQRIVWDLIKYQPEEIKVFNVNFYAGNLYHEKYRPRGEEPTLKSLGLQHDPVQSFMFSQMLYKTKIVKFDKVASGILEMSIPDYIDYLQKNYGDVWRSAQM